MIEQETFFKWRNRLISPFSPGPLTGITLGNWLRLLIDNRFRISVENWPRIASITILAIISSSLSQLEELKYGDHIRKIDIQPPVFILGAPRSGTSFLYELLCKDPRFGFPNTFQVRNPNTFLISESIATRWTSWLIEGNRGMDRVKSTWHNPGEDEFATCLLTLYSTLLSNVFPQRKGYYYRYSTFEGVPDCEIRAWKTALHKFLQKVTIVNNRPLMLKSPNHMGRVSLLLNLFPNAKFIMITRNPYAIYQSGLKAFTYVARRWNLQRDPHPDKVEEVLQYYQRVFHAFFEQRGMIPKDHLYTIRFEDLETDPLGQISNIYKALNLPDIKSVAKAFEQYVNFQAGYQKNYYPELPTATMHKVWHEWRAYFEEYKYPALL